MAKIDKVLENGDKIILKSEADFDAAILLIEKKLLRDINKLFENVDIVAGKLSSNQNTIDFINSLDNRIRTSLKKSGYNAAVSDLLTTFKPIQDNNIQAQATLNNINIQASSLNDLTKLETQNTIDKLLGSGISRDFIIPIRESIYRNIILGSSIQDAQETIRNYIISEDGKDSKLLRYAGQVAEDSLNQYGGTIQQKIKNELGLSDFIYFGTLITDSRCQCRYWVHKTKLPGEELVDEIQMALDGDELDGCACSGMIPDTTIDTFAINRGGFRCRHRALPTKL